MNRQEQKIQTRNRILKTAIEEFASKGYSAAKLGDIAAKSDVVNSMVTHYFGSKEELYNEAVDYVTKNINLIDNTMGDDLLGMLLGIVTKIKTLALDNNNEFELLSSLFTSRDIPENTILKIQNEFEESNLFIAMKDAMRNGTIISGGIWRVFYMFVASCFAITSSYNEVDLALPDDNYYLRLIRYNAHVGENNYAATKDTLISLRESDVPIFVRDLKKVFDIVRIVDFNRKMVRKYDNSGHFTLEDYTGPTQFESDDIESTLTGKAMKYNSRQDKFEFNGNDMYQLSSQPIMINGEKYALELIIMMKDNILLDAHGNIKVSNVIDGINKRIYLDSLTDAYNRRYYDDCLYNLNAEQAFCILDIDNFKSVNDTYGHLVGDETIREIAGCIKKHIRSCDALVRYGGDEFLLCFRNISEEVFKIRIDDIRHSVSQIVIKDAPNYVPTISIGAIYNKTGHDIDFEKADALLYAAKKDKNTVVFADDVNIDFEELLKNKDTKKLTENVLLRSQIAQGYDFVASVNTGNTETKIEYISDEFKKIYDSLGDGKVEAKTEKLLKEIICDEDKYEILRNSTNEIVLSKLENSESYILSFRANLNGAQPHFELRFFADNEQKTSFLMCIRNTEERFIRDLNLQRSNAIIDAMVKQHSCIYFYNIKTKDFVPYDIRDVDYLAELYVKNNKLDWDSVNQYIDERIHNNSKRDLFDFLANIQETLRNNKTASISCRRKYDDGTYLYSTLVVIKTEKENEEPNQLIVCFDESNDEVIQQERLELAIKFIRRLLENPFTGIDTDKAIDYLLKIVSDFYESDRAQIYEFSPDGKSASNTYAFCYKDVKNNMNRLQNLDIRKLNKIINVIKENKIYNSDNYIDLGAGLGKDVYNIMAAPMFKDNALTGYISIDNSKRFKDYPIVLSMASYILLSELSRTRRGIQEAKILTKITDPYVAIYYINSKEDYVNSYMTKDYFEKRTKMFKSVDHFIETFLSECVTDADMPRARKQFNRENVLSYLKDHNVFVFEYIDKANGDEDERNCEISVIKISEKLEDFVVCITDHTESVKRQMQVAHEQQRQLELIIKDRTFELEKRNSDLIQVNEDIVELLGNLTEARDIESGEHIRRVKEITNIVANEVMKSYPEYELTPEKVALITSTSALHDIGKISIPDSILLKPGRFTPEERKIMEAHCSKGVEILRLMPEGWSKDYTRVAKEICLSHHEKWDGNGYPEHLKGDDIPISAQIVSVADCFEALVSKRVYKDKYSLHEAFNMILNNECGVFNPKIMQAFIDGKDAVFECVKTTGSKVKIESEIIETTKKLEGQRILYAEDNELTREIGSEILTNEGAVVVEADNGKMAYELYMSQDFDTILLDLTMPELGGIDATKLIRTSNKKNSKDIQIVALSSSTDVEDIKRCLDAGMDAYLVKPVEVDNLVSALNSKSEVESIDKTIKRYSNNEYTRDLLTNSLDISSYTDRISELSEQLYLNNKLDLAVVYVDINGTHDTNNEYSHEMGNLYIKNASNIIKEVYGNDEVYRVGGDNFIVLLTGENYEKRDELLTELREKSFEASRIEKIKDGKTSFASGMSEFDYVVDPTISSVVKKARVEMYNNKRLTKISGGGSYLVINE